MITEYIANLVLFAIIIFCPLDLLRRWVELRRLRIRLKKSSIIEVEWHFVDDVPKLPRPPQKFLPPHY